MNTKEIREAFPIAPPNMVDSAITIHRLCDEIDRLQEKKSKKNHPGQVIDAQEKLIADLQSRLRVQGREITREKEIVSHLSECLKERLFPLHTKKILRLEAEVYHITKMISKREKEILHLNTLLTERDEMISDLTERSIEIQFKEHLERGTEDK